MSTALLTIVEGNSSQVSEAVTRRLVQHLSWLGFHAKAFKDASCRDAKDNKSSTSDVSCATDAGLESALDWFASDDNAQMIAVLDCGAVARGCAAAAARHRAIHERCAAHSVDALLVHYCLDVEVPGAGAGVGVARREADRELPNGTMEHSPSPGARECGACAHVEKAAAAAAATAADCEGEVDGGGGGCGDGGERHKKAQLAAAAKHLPNGVSSTWAAECALLGGSDALAAQLPSVYFEYSSQRVLINRLRGVLQEKVLNFVRRIDWIDRTIYLCKHGESEDNVNGKLGGDSALTERGREFSRALGRHVSEEVMRAMSHARKSAVRSGYKSAGASPGHVPPQQPLVLRVLTSNRYRTKQTASLLGLLLQQAPTTRRNKEQDGTPSTNSHIGAYFSAPTAYGALNEVHAGLCEGLTYEDIKSNFPQELTARDLDKFRYAFPLGESYADVNVRLESLLLDLEREPLTLIICHQGVGRSILAYYLHKSTSELPYLEMAPHNLYKLQPEGMSGLCSLERVVFDIPAAKTHRERPASSGSAEPVPHELTLLKMPGSSSGSKSATCEDAVPLRPDASLFSPTIPLTPAFGSAATVVHSSAPADFLIRAAAISGHPAASVQPPAFVNVAKPLKHSHPSAPRLDREAAAAPPAVAQS